MAIKSGFFQSIEGDRPYMADDFNGLFNEILTEGIFKLSADSEPFTVSLNPFTEPVSLLSRERVKTRSVTPRITQLGEIVVSPGWAWLNKTWIRNDSDAIYPLLLHESFTEGSTQTWKIRVYLKTDPKTRSGTVVCLNGALVNSTNMADANLNRGFPNAVDGDIHYDIIGELVVTSDGSTIVASQLNSLGSQKLPYVTSKIGGDKIDIKSGVIFLNDYYSQTEVNTLVNDSKFKQSYIADLMIRDVYNLTTICKTNPNYGCRVLSISAHNKSNNGGWHKQFAFDTITNDIFYRVSNDNNASPASWTAWTKLAMTNYVDTTVTNSVNAAKTALTTEINKKVNKAGDTMTGQLIMPTGTNKPLTNAGAVMVGATTGQHLNIYNYGMWAAGNAGQLVPLYLNAWGYRTQNANNLGTANYTCLTEFPVVIGNSLRMTTAADNNTGYVRTVLQLFPTYTIAADGTMTSSTSYGGDLVLNGAGQQTVICAGESYNYYYGTKNGTVALLTNETSPANNGENLFLTADVHVIMVSGYQTPANRQQLYWNSSGQLHPLGNGLHDIGHATFPWKRMWIAPTPTSYINSNKGNGGGIYTTTKSTGTNVFLTLINAGSANGRFMLGVLGTQFHLTYTANTVISAGTNSVAFSVNLMDEAGNTQLNKVTRGVWNGTAIGVAYGGTGLTTIASGQALIGNGTGNVTTRAITNNASAASGLTRNTNLVTMNTLSYGLNRTTGVAAADTAYTTYMARGIAASTSTPSSLTNGTVHLKYT